MTLLSSLSPALNKSSSDFCFCFKTSLALAGLVGGTELRVGGVRVFLVSFVSGSPAVLGLKDDMGSVSEISGGGG